MKKRLFFIYLVSLFYWVILLGCATAPAPILEASGNSNLAELLETIRVEERLPALAAAVIIDGDIYAAAAVGIRKFGTENWVTVNDRFLIASCSKAFTATLANAIAYFVDLSIQKSYDIRHRSLLKKLWTKEDKCRMEILKVHLS